MRRSSSTANWPASSRSVTSSNARSTNWRRKAKASSPTSPRRERNGVDHLPIDAEDAVFDGRFDVEKMDLLRDQRVEQPRRLVRRHRDQHLDRLIREFEEVRGMHAPVGAKALVAAVQARAAQPLILD